jgi:hypothetical protein
MKIFSCSLTLLYLLVQPWNLQSQKDSGSIDNIYGLDPLLYNGKKYTYFLPSGTVGHQFLNSPGYTLGSVTIKDRIFEGTVLNYDVFNQQLLLQYAHENGSLSILEVSKAWLGEFRLGEMTFIYKDFGEGVRFYQKLGEGKNCILYHWTKLLKLDVTYGSNHFAYTPAMKDSWVMSEGRISPFKNKRTFISQFSPEIRPLIGDYMRQHRVKLKNAPDQAVTQLIDFINSLE